MADPPRTAPRSTPGGRRAVFWIIALALAVFVMTYATSPRETPGGGVSDLGARSEVVPGQGP